MMTALEALILGLVQGITEFLPVSSSGHLTIGQWLLKRTDAESNIAFDIAFDIVVHVATLLVVLVMLGRKLVALVRERPRLIGLVILGTVPVGIVGLLLKDHVAVLKKPQLVAALWMGMGVILILGERFAPRGGRSLDEMRWHDALLVGIAQAAAIAPGISRSGTTILSGLHRGLDREAAFLFSFALYVPAVIGAAVVKATDIRVEAAANPAALGIGFVAAFASGAAALWLLRRVVRAKKLAWFGAYCLAVGAAVLLIS